MTRPSVPAAPAAVSLVLTLLPGLFATALAARPGHAKANILFLMADQMRFDAFAAGKNHSGHAGTPAHDVPSWTPALDGLAREGMLFARAYSSTPTCTPARAALLTGQSPWQHGMLGYGRVARRYPFEMPRALREAGFTTHSFGKDHFDWNESDTRAFEPNRHGYQTTDLYEGIVTEQDDYHRWFRQFSDLSPEKAGWPTLDMNSWRGAPFELQNESLHPTKYVGDRAVAFLKAQGRAARERNASFQPWFAKVSFHRPHSPYDPPRRILDAIRDIDLPPVVVGGWDDLFKTDEKHCGPQNLDAWCGAMPDPALSVARRAYRGSIAFVDEQIGRIMGALEEEGLLESTFVLFTADHGDGQGDHYHWRKGYPYEFSAHVPMIVRWPAAFADNLKPRPQRGRVDVTHIVALRDVFPTFLDVAGAMGSVPKNHTLQGASLLPLLSGTGGADWRPWLDLEHTTCYNATNHWNALSDGEMKYIFNAFSATEQLFNMTADPYELRDLSATPTLTPQLDLWRSRMVQQFKEEERGPDWVKEGKLQQRTVPCVYSPNYPKDWTRKS